MVWEELGSWNTKGTSHQDEILLYLSVGCGGGGRRRGDTDLHSLDHVCLHQSSQHLLSTWGCALLQLPVPGGWGSSQWQEVPKLPLAELAW